MPKSKPSNDSPAKKPKAENSPKAEKSPKAAKAKSVATRKNNAKSAQSFDDEESPIVPFLTPKKETGDENLSPFLRKQREKLLILRDGMLDSMHGVAEGNLRTRAEGSEASAFGLHQADAGSDAYDRDFALSLLSQEQDALYEIEEALKRIEQGTYGVCEMSGKSIPHPRLEAIPFTRFTVECQSQLEKQNRSNRVRQSVTSLFGLTDGADSDGDDDDSGVDTKD